MSETEGQILTIFGKDSRSFESFFREYYPKLLGYAGLLVDRLTAEDVVQDLFAWLWNNKEQLSITTSVNAYLLRSVHNRCMNVIRQDKVRKSHTFSELSNLDGYEEIFFNPEENTTLEKLIFSETQGRINKAIQSLPDQCRKVFILRYEKGLRTKEIAEKLGISLRTVENHIYKAVKILKKILSPDMFFWVWIILNL